jgi:signal recognition particle receptor subunit beta
MATFNFSTMQMTVKVVYYGPGLCGKTTNLQYIYGHTTPNSRGEMVSLETKADRTLFFDLLPIEVGTIAGFKTKIQLYTVPGQVFYNTTRKLVLKGVDGIVFVADSQRPMLQSNVESLSNLKTNLAELGIVIDTVPMVFQYNKRDLQDVCTMKELDGTLNSREIPRVEAAALTGMGVFETLRAISKLTLGALKKQLEEGSPAAARVPLPAQPKAPTGPVAEKLTGAAQAVPPPQARPTPGPQPTAARAVASAAPAARPAASSPAPVRAADAKPATVATPAPARPRPRPAPPAPKREANRTSRNLLLRLDQPDLERTHRVTLSLRLEDADQRLVQEVRNVQLDLDRADQAEDLQLQLNIRLHPRS